MSRLRDRVVIVTGGAQGIGRAYCEGLAREGAKVVVADIDGPRGEATAEQIRQSGAEALAVQTDVSRPEATEHMARATLERFGRIDGLVNNAAMYQRPAVSRGTIDQIPLDEWDRVMSVNVKGVFLCCRAVVPVMREQRSGKVVNISSGTVMNGTPNFMHYVTSKAAVIGITRTLAREVGEYNITVNAIAPGLTLSLDDVPDSEMGMYQSRTLTQCIKRVEKPEDLVGTVIFLCSDDSDFITGQTLLVNGGGSFL